jgi:BASS family bile acid:Na+ symporter
LSTTELVIRILTAGALAGLLAAVGLRLTWAEILDALRRCRFTAIVIANFLVVPALAAAVARIADLSPETAVAMILLGAAPFAPVVPVFARMARADLALAAGLTAVFPLLSAALTPLAAGGALRWVVDAGTVSFKMWSSLGVLLATITLPLAAGVAVRHLAPALARRLLRPVEVLSEATGAASLAFVVFTEFDSIIGLGWRAWLAMALVSELSMLLGWLLGGRARAARQVIALGTANRNIALALLVAIQSFPGTPIVSAVVGNGLLLILLGLLHVAWWRFGPAQGK